MGVRGPIPIPTALQRARGNPGHRRLRGELEAPIGPPKPPSYLKGRQRFWWKHWVGILSQIPGLLTQVDQGALADLAIHDALLESAVVAHQKMPAEFVKDETGKTIKNPYIVLIQEETAIRDRLRAKVGGSPADRTRLNISSGGKTKENKFQQFGS